MFRQSRAAKVRALHEFVMEARASEEKGKVRVPTKHFSTIDVERLKTQLEWGQLAAWRQELALSLKGFSDVAFELVSAPAAVYEEWRAESYPRDVAQVDAWAAQQLVATLDASSQRVKWVLRSLRKQPTSVRTSVVRTMLAVREAIRRNPESEERAKEAFEKRTFFRLGDEEEKTMVGASTLRDEYEALPEEARLSRNGLLRAFLRHMPASMVRLRDDWRAQLMQCEVTGRPLPWSYDELSLLLAQHLGRGGSGAPEANAALTGKPWKPQGGGGASRAGVLCDNCGKQGHIAKECRKHCPTCKEKSCPGSRGEPCIVHSTKPITTFKGAVGRVIPQFILQKLQQAQAKWMRQEASRGGVHAAEELGPDLDQWGADDEDVRLEVSVAQERRLEVDPGVAAAAQRDVLERVLLGEATAAMAGAGDSE